MQSLYRANPIAAVRGQGFIRLLHAELTRGFEARLLPARKRNGVRIVEEATIFGSHKTKDVDVAVIDPVNGPLVIVGVRSQMSSVGKNALNYYEGIIGECISLQERFPMAVIGYVYLHPLKPILVGKEFETIDHTRYAKMYAAITGRTGQDYKNVRGIYDHFAYMVVDFTNDPPVLRDDIVEQAVPRVDLSIGTFVDRMVTTFSDRHLFVEMFN